MLTSSLPTVVLRSGLALAFLFPPINALYDPISWIGYFPGFMHGLLPDMILLHTFGIIEVAIALWILSGKHIFIPCTLAAVMLLAIVAFNFQDFQVLFRDVSIASIAISLALSARKAEQLG